MPYYQTFNDAADSAAFLTVIHKMPPLMNLIENETEMNCFTKTSCRIGKKRNEFSII